MILDRWALKQFAKATIVALGLTIGVEIIRQLPEPIEIASVPTLAVTVIPALTFTPPTAAPTRIALGNAAPYPNYGPAAELRPVEWLNTETPPRLANLRGRVVLLAFWGIDCAECLPVLPYVRQWDALYADQGLTVIGIHTPVRASERSLTALRAELVRLDVTYPVARDDQNAIWQSYGGRIRPTILLIDKAGNLRYQREAGGGFDATESAIEALLAEIHTPTN